MSIPRPLLRWLPTFLAFPAAGLVTITLLGPLGSTGSGLVAGGLAGAIVGGAQWFALRSSGIRGTWWVATIVGAALGTAVGLALTAAGTASGDLVVRGLVAGAAVGLAQAWAAGRSAVVALAWTATTATAWGIGWWITSRVIVDAERSFVVFGSSGALVATLLTGAALPLLLRGRAPRTLDRAAGPSLDLTDSEVAR
jgi:hypothetical protein